MLIIHDELERVVSVLRIVKTIKKVLSSSEQVIITICHVVELDISLCTFKAAKIYFKIVLLYTSLDDWDYWFWIFIIVREVKSLRTFQPVVAYKMELVWNNVLVTASYLNVVHNEAALELELWIKFLDANWTVWILFQGKIYACQGHDGMRQYKALYCRR